MEGYGPSTYGDRFADVYDDWYADVSDAEATVARVAALAAAAGAPAGPVLELGAGSGRLAVPLAAAGLETWALDASTAMLDRLRAKPGGDRVHVVVGDMGRLDLGPAAPAFAVVLCAFNTFFNLTSTDDQGRCLAAVAGRLAPGGRLVVEAFVPPPGDGDGPDGGDGPGDGTGVVAGPVSSVEARHIGLDDVVLTVSRLDPATRTITGQHVQLSEAGVRLRPWVLHYASPDQLDALAAGAGLALVERHAGWRGEPFGPSSRTHVSVYGPAAGGGGAP